MGKSFYRYYKRSIAAGDTAEINVFGKFLALLAWDGTNKALVQIGENSEEEFPAGVSIELPADENGQVFFGKVRIRNNNASTSIVELAISAGLIFDSRLTLSGSVLDNILDEMRGATTAQGYGLVTVGTATTQVVASNTSRKSALIQNLPTNTGLMYIGFDNTLTTSNYVAVLSPGQIYSVDDYLGDLYCLGSVAAEKVSYGEV